MISPSPDSEHADRADAALVAAAVRACGPLVREAFGRPVQTWSKGAAGPVSEIDLACNALLEERLRTARPAYGWLSEESPDRSERLERARVFIVDPIDGTRAFLAGETDFCIAVAVVENGAPVAAAVYNPVLEEMFEAFRGGGARLNGAPIRASQHKTLEAAHLAGKPDFYADKRWATPWPALQLTHVSALAYRIALAAAGRLDAVVALGAKHDWDVAAAALLVEEAGGRITDPTGAALVYNTPAARLPGLVAAGPALHPLLLEQVRSTADPRAWPA